MSTTDLAIGLSMGGGLAVFVVAALGTSFVVWLIRRRRARVEADLKSPLLKLSQDKRPIKQKKSTDDLTITVVESDLQTNTPVHVVDVIQEKPVQNKRQSLPRPLPTTQYIISTHKQLLQEWLVKLGATHPIVTFQYIEIPDSDKNIQYNEDQTIKFATLQKLVENLIKENAAEPHIREQFFATYTSFTTPDQLLSLFITAHDFYFQKSQTSLADKCISLIRYWLDHYLIDLILCNSKNDALVQLAQFVVRTNNQETENIAQFMCEKAIKKKISVDRTLPLLVLPAPVAPSVEEDLKEEVLETDPSPGEEEEDNSPLYPDEQDDGWKRGEFNILEWPAKEVARQLTLIETERFTNIPCHELVGSRYSERNMKTQAPNLARVIDFFNTFSQWVCSQIVQYEDVDMRTATVMYFIDVMEQLIALGNFNSLMSILGAINNSAINRLQRTLEGLSEESVELLQMIDELTSTSKKFSNLRQAFQASPNCVPFVGIFLGDLAQIEGVNKNKKIDDGIEMINWSRSKYSTNVLRLIQQYQSSKYNIVPVPFLKDSLERAKSELTEDQIYEQSLVVEPRQA
jgi:hypothetical protein